MKRILLTFTVLPLILLAGWGCAKNDEATQKSGEMSFAPITYAGNYGEYQWKADAVVGVFMMPLAETAIANSTYKNATYKYEAGRMVAATVGDKIIFPDAGEWMKFISYTPRQADLVAKNYMYDINVLNQADYRDVDFLYSNTGARYSSALNDVKVVYKHMLSKIVMVFESADPVKLNAISGVKSKAFPHSIQFNFKNETFTPPTRNLLTELNLVEYAGAKAGTRVFEMITVPQGAFTERKLIYTDAQGTKELGVMTADSYQSGKVNTYTIKLDVLEVQLGAVSVLPWGVGADDQLNQDLDVTAKFTDPVFNQWVRTTFCAGRSVIMVSDLVNVESVVIAKSKLTGIKTIATLAGIEYFPNLRTLDVSNSADGATSGYGFGIQTLNVSLNKKLEVLNCEKNALTQNTINTSNNYELYKLVCGSNTALTSLDLANNVRLTYLDFSSTGITAKDVSIHSHLETLICSGNNMLLLDVTSNTKLVTLHCSSNRLAVIDVSKNLALTDLDCASNSLTALSVSSNTKLKKLNCGTNTNITELDVSSNLELVELRCAHDRLITLDVSKNTKLERLLCNNNNTLATLNVSNNPELISLSCQSNILTGTISLIKSPKLTTFICNNNGLTGIDVTNSPKLMTLYCHDNKLEALNLIGNPILSYLSCQINKIPSLDISSHSNIGLFTNFTIASNPGNRLEGGTITPVSFGVKLPAGVVVSNYPNFPANATTWSYAFPTGGSFNVALDYTN